jgi:NADPH-dependent ferric siderophore reductase
MIPKVRRAKTRKMITLEVRANTAPSPAFRTITLGGPELAAFEPAGDDQAVRLFFPRAGQDGCGCRPWTTRPGRRLRPRRELPAAGRGSWQLLAADESALPAVLAILEGAPPDLAAEVFLEVPAKSDIREVEAPPGVRVHWLPRLRAGRPGTLALQAVREAGLPLERAYAWVAGEAALATGVRRHLVRDRGWPKSDVAFLGYWRHGRASPG